MLAIVYKYGNKIGRLSSDIRSFPHLLPKYGSGATHVRETAARRIRGSEWGSSHKIRNPGIVALNPAYMLDWILYIYYVITVAVLIVIKNNI